MGILKNMLYRAYHLCDPGPEREEEIKTLNFAFINQNYPPKQVLKLFNPTKNLMEMKRKTKELKKGQSQLLFHT